MPNKEKVTIRCIDNSKVELSLTIGKDYVKLTPPQYNLSDTVWVENDRGILIGYFKTRFEEIQNDN